MDPFESPEMTRGRKSDLPIVRALRGTAPLTALAPLVAAAGDVPDPPIWLDFRGAAEWRVLAPLLQASQRPPAEWASRLSVLCGVYSWIRRALEAEVAPKAALVAQFRGLASDLGLGHATRLPDTAPRENRFERFKGLRPEGSKS